MNGDINVYLVVVLCQFQHFFDDSFIELAVLTVVLQGEAFHPALLMQVQQHLEVKKTMRRCSIFSIKSK